MRLAWCGPEVELESLINAKSGACPEDCAFCSQSVRFDTDVDVYAFLDLDEILDAARATRAAGATQFCIVVAVRGPEERLLGKVIDAVDAVHARDRASRSRARSACSTASRRERLAAAGVRRYNHNLETCRELFPTICTTHTYDDRVDDRAARHATPAWSCAAAASSAWARRSSSASTSRSSSPSSNRARCRSTCSTRGPARRSASSDTLTPREALQAIALFRLILPDAWLRLAGGRERVLGELQGMGLLAGANALIVGNYLTTIGRVARRRPRAARGARHAGRRRPGRGPLRRRRHRRPRPPRAAASIPVSSA